MRRLTVFNAMSPDGFIADSTGDMSWAHRQDQEWNSFVRGNASGEGVLVFGRKYQVALAPVLLGGGKSMFAAVREKPALRLAGTRSFPNGTVFLTYHRA